MEAANTPPIAFITTFKPTASSSSSTAPTPLNKMELPSENIATSLRPPALFFSMPDYHSNSGLMPYSLPSTSSTTYPPKHFVTTPPINYFTNSLKTTPLSASLAAFAFHGTAHMHPTSSLLALRLVSSLATPTPTKGIGVTTPSPGKSTSLGTSSSTKTSFHSNNSPNHPLLNPPPPTIHHYFLLQHFNHQPNPQDHLTQSHHQFAHQHQPNPLPPMLLCPTLPSHSPLQQYLTNTIWSPGPKPDLFTLNPSSTFSSPPHHFLTPLTTQMSEEFHALQQQGTWSLVPPPPDANIISCQWT